MKTRLVTLVLSAFFTSPLLLAADPMLPSHSEIVDRLNQEYWIINLRQIPATVIGKGIMRNIPYLSYKSRDYELNIYGDPEKPAAVELGVYGSLLNDKHAKKRCVDFICGLVRYQSRAQKEAWEYLDYEKDIITNGEMTVEITPPTDEDAYGGWWISAYSVKALDSVRATPDDLAAITVPKKVSQSQTNVSGWTEEDMKLARPTKPAEASAATVIIAGVEYKNARIVKKNPAEVTIYHSSGVATIPIEDLSVDMQLGLGYDPAAAAAFRDARAHTQEQAAQRAVDEVAAQKSVQSDQSSFTSPAQSYNEGRVYVPSYSYTTYVGPRGGVYHYSASGGKVYERHR